MAARRHGGEDLGHIAGVMDPGNLGLLRERRLDPLQSGEFVGIQGLQHRLQAGRAFRMHGTGIVLDADRVAKEQCRHVGAFPFPIS